MDPKQAHYIGDMVSPFLPCIFESNGWRKSLCVLQRWSWKWHPHLSRVWSFNFYSLHKWLLGGKCNKWKFDKSTSLSPHFQLHCLCFQQPAVNRSMKILDGKFQKWAVLTFWIPCVLGRMMNSAGLHWSTQYMSHSLAQRILPLCATLTIDQQCGVGQSSIYAKFRATCSFRHPPEVLACMLCGRQWGGDVFCLICEASFFILNKWI